MKISPRLFSPLARLSPGTLARLLALALSLASPLTLRSQNTFVGWTSYGTTIFGGTSASSENEQFSAQIVQPDQDNIFVEVYRTAPDSRTLLWSTPIEYDSSTSPTGELMPGTFLVSNDGQAVVLRDGFMFGDEKLWLVKKSGHKLFSHSDLAQLLGVDTKGSADAAESLSTLPGHFKSLAATRLGFQFLAEEGGRPAYFVWVPAKSTWLLGDFENLTLTIPETARQQEITASARERARRLIRRHQPGGVAQTLQSLRSKAAEILPGFDPGDDPSQVFHATQDAYGFIASLRNPADKKYIEQLLTWPFDYLQSAGYFSSSDFASEERALGDALLAQWNGLTNNNVLGGLVANGIFLPGEQHYLATIKGTVELPIPVPDQTGDLLLYLIPAHLPLGKWQQNSAVRTFWIVLQEEYMPGSAAGLENFPFTLSTLTPGEYRLHVFWDRRPPYASPEERASPQAGDYTSAEVPVKLTAGGTLDLSIPCTNRVGQADEYYAADEAWKKLGPEIQAAREMEAEMNDEGEKVLFTAPLSDWFPATNQPPAGLFSGIRIVQQSGDPQAHSLLKISRRENPFDNLETMQMFQLVDEHGCPFAMNISSAGVNETSDYFPIYPRTASEFTLLLQETTFDLNQLTETQEKETTFTIKNLKPAQRADWKPDPLPAQRDFDAISVVYTGYDSEHEYDPGRAKFQFTREGKPVPGWTGHFMHFEDSQGNRGDSLLVFCRKETLFKARAKFMRDPSAEFAADETWTLTLAEVPAAGEYRALNQEKTVQGLRIELLAITGSGQFTYRGDEIIAGQAQIESKSNPFSPHAHFQNGPSEHFKVYELPSQFNFFGSTSSKRVLVSRVPHLALRLTGLQPEHEWRLVQADSADRMAHFQPPGQSTFSYLPLQYQPGETNPKLTFQVQKALEAEFIVTIPERPDLEIELPEIFQSTEAIGEK